ncbi:hypothetical protein J3F83DRAFT_738630 [Trichoderma novae-zelandiae]
MVRLSRLCPRILRLGSGLYETLLVLFAQASPVSRPPPSQRREPPSPLRECGWAAGSLGHYSERYVPGPPSAARCQ